MLNETSRGMEGGARDLAGASPSFYPSGEKRIILVLLLVNFVLDRTRPAGQRNARLHERALRAPATSARYLPLQ
jgi:hypothetical protein